MRKPPTRSRAKRPPPPAFEAWWRGLSSSLKAWAGAVAAATVVVVAIVGIDDRYVHAADLADLNSKLEVNRLTAEAAILQIRRDQLNDRIYDTLAKIRGRPSPEQASSLERSKQEAVLVDRELAEKRRAIERLKIGR